MDFASIPAAFAVTSAMIYYTQYFSYSTGTLSPFGCREKLSIGIQYPHWIFCV